MPATGMHSIEQGRGYNRSITLIRPYPFCTLQDKWHGVDCPTMWPASGGLVTKDGSPAAWCQPCRDFEAAR